MSDNMNNMNNNDNFTSTVSGVERVSKKRGKKIALISGITAVALVGGGVAAYNLSDFVKNQVNLRVMKPDNYYAWVTEENSKNFAQSAKESYSKAYDKMQNGQNSTVSLKYTASDGFKDYALSEILGEEYSDYTDEESQMIVDIINNINEVTIGGNANTKDGILSGSVFASLNGENLISGDIAFDNENFDYFLRVPELTEQWLCVSTGESMNELPDMNAYYDFMKNPTEYLSPEQLEDMIIRYTNVWNQYVEDIEMEKKESVDICDITVDYTVLSVELNESDLVNIAEDFIEEAKNDDVLKNIAVSLGECTEEEWVSELDEILAELADEDTSNNDVQLTVSTDVDPNGDIRGMRFFVEDEGDIFFACGKDGDNVRGEFSVTEDNEELFSAELYADENDNKYSGNIDFTYSDYEDVTETISVEFNDYEVVDEENGYFNADVNLVIPDVDPIAIDFSSDGNAQDISYNINFDGTDYGTVTLSMSANDGADVSIPDKNGAFVVSPYMDSEPALADYIPEENMKTFIHDILVKIGFSEEVAADGAEDIALDMYADSDDWETYEDFDSEVEADDFSEYDEYVDTEIVEETTAESDENVWIPDEEGMFSVGDADEADSAINESQNGVDFSLQQTDEYQEVVDDVVERAESLRDSVE